MFRRFFALIWLRTQIIMTNKNIIVPMVMPYAFLIIFKYSMGFDKSSGEMLLYLCMSMAIGMAVGNPISTMISEEKEKNNLTTLMLSGVRQIEYILSILFYPVIMTLINIFALPVLAEVDFNERFSVYALVIFLTSVVVVLINFIIGTMASNQSKSQFYAMIFTMIISMGPSISSVNPEIKHYLSYTFIGAYMNFFSRRNFVFWSETGYYLLGWLSFTMILLLISVNKIYKNKSN